MSDVVTCSFCGDLVAITAEDALILSLVGDVPIQCEDCREWYSEWLKPPSTGIAVDVFHGMVWEDGWSPVAAYRALGTMLPLGGTPHRFHNDGQGDRKDDLTR